MHYTQPWSNRINNFSELLKDSQVTAHVRVSKVSSMDHSLFDSKVLPLCPPLWTQEENETQKKPQNPKLKHLPHLLSLVPDPTHPNKRPTWIYIPLNYVNNMKKKILKI